MRLLLLTLVCFISCICFSQDEFKESKVKFKDKNYFVRGNYQWGKVLASNAFVAGQNSTGQVIDQFHSFSIELGIQTDGSKLWHHVWSKPQFGIGYYQSDYGDNNELGQPSALYLFYDTPIKRWKNFGVFFTGGLGLTWNWQPYQHELNPWNIAIGSYNTVYIDVGVKGIYKLGNHIDLLASYTFTHFSNGASSLPNSGINQTGLRLGVAYQFQDERPSQEKIELPKFNKESEFSISSRFAIKQVKFDTAITKLKTEYLGLNYGYIGLDATYHYKLTRFFNIGAAIDFGYDGSTTAQLDVVDSVYNPVETPFEDHFNVSALYSMEAVINRFTLVGQIGYYVIRKEIPNQTPDLFQRIAVRIKLYEGLFFTGGLRAYNWGIADHIEWGLGYRF